MKERAIHIDECNLGMRIAEPVYNEYGAVIIPKGSVLNPYIKERLRGLGLEYLKVYEVPADDSSTREIDRELKQTYNENTLRIKGIIRNISAGGKPSNEEIKNISESILSKRNRKRDIIRCIDEMRNKDEYTYYHSINVSMLSMLIGGWLQLDDNEIEDIAKAGLLHDLGKALVPDEILNKPGPLTMEEFDIIRKHPVQGYRLIENNREMDDQVKKAVLMHHERNDGSGYPVGIKGEKISLYAKILAVADVFDSMTSERVYRPRTSPFVVFEMMERDCFGILDPEVTRTFLKNITMYYLGESLELENGKQGEIVYINPMNYSRPIIRVGKEYLDLSSDMTLRISP